MVIGATLTGVVTPLVLGGAYLADRTAELVAFDRSIVFLLFLPVLLAPVPLACWLVELLLRATVDLDVPSADDPFCCTAGRVTSCSRAYAPTAALAYSPKAVRTGPDQDLPRERGFAVAVERPEGGLEPGSEEWEN